MNTRKRTSKIRRKWNKRRRLEGPKATLPLLKWSDVKEIMAREHVSIGQWAYYHWHGKQS